MSSAASISLHACVLNRLSCVRLFVTPWIIALNLLCAWNFPGKNSGVGCHFLLQGIFSTQGLSPHLLKLMHCRWIFPLSHQGSWTLNFPCATNSFRSPFTYSFRSPSITLCPHENNFLFHYFANYLILKFSKFSWLLPIPCIIHAYLQITFHLTT